MFRKSEITNVIEADTSDENSLPKRSLKRYNDRSLWHNQFSHHVTNQVDESIFEPLFNKCIGAPNMPIRQLIGLNIIKAGFGYSDEQLFDQVQFNLLFRKALGITERNNAGPSVETYYLFRRRILDYEREKGINLYELCFNSICKSQALEFEVEGKSVRMDSKLIGSNISWYSRFQIVHEIAFMASKHLTVIQLQSLKKENRITHQSLLAEPAKQLVYTETAFNIEKRLTQLGYLIQGLLVHFPNTLPHYQLLKRIFNEQFIVEKKRVIPRNKKFISAQSVQNPHDPDATYRRKDEQKVKGYSTNITETCNEEGLNLITNVQVKNVSAADNGFFEKAITDSQDNVLYNKIQNVYVDGAYNSEDNRIFADQQDIKLYLTGIQGKPPRFNLEQTEQGLKVTDSQTGLIEIALQTKENQWRIKRKKVYRYFTQKEIDSALLRKQLKEIPPEHMKKRNNVEATIFQYCFHTRNNKTRYRGLGKHKLLSFARCLWINLVRIVNYEIKICQGAF